MIIFAYLMGFGIGVLLYHVVVGYLAITWYERRRML